MKRFRVSALIPGIILAWTWNVAAQGQPGAAGDTSDEGDRKLTAWQWRREVGLAAPGGGHHALKLPPEVLGKSGPGLNDLRIADAEGKRIPFALRVLRTKFFQNPVPVTREYNAGLVEGKGYYEVTLELGDMGQLGYNEIEIAASGKDYRRKVEVLGANNAEFTSARQFLPKDSFIAHYTVDGTVIDLRKLRFPPSTERFIKVRCYADASNPQDAPKIEKAIVRFSEAVVGEEVTHPARLEARQPAAGKGGPGSEWFIDLGPNPVPCERLVFEVIGSPVQRPFRVDAFDDHGRQEYVPTRQHWTWRKSENRQLLEIAFTEERWTRRLRFQVTDFANPPLDLHSVNYVAAARQLIFLPDEPGKTSPLYLYYGNPDASPANYDFARQLPPVLTPAPIQAALGHQEPNRYYVPPTQSLSEQMPWLIYAVLGFTSLAMLALLGYLSRNAIRRHDAAKSAA